MKTALALIVVVVVAIAGYFLFANKTQAPVTNPAMTGGNSAPLETTNPNAATTGSTTVTTTTTVTTPKTVTVTYNGSTFSPASVTIKKGDSVKFVNSSSGPMWVASAVHPTHTVYSGTNVNQHCPDTTGTAFDQCSAGSSYTFTFGKTGTWNYHNHASASAQGTVVVQ